MQVCAKLVLQKPNQASKPQTPKKKTLVQACVTQSADSLSESVSTLRFAMQASHVKNKVTGDLRVEKGIL